MKKQIIILSFLIIHFSSGAQDRIPTKGPCTPEMCVKAKGKWINGGDDISPSLNFSKQQQQEALKRMYEIQQMMFGIYPNPIGVDAVRGISLGNGHFGSLAKYYVNSDGKITFDYLKEVLTPAFRYTCGFPTYYCANDKKNEMMAGHTNETNSGIRIFVNNLDWFAGTPLDDTMTVDRRPVKVKAAVKEIWKGFELLYSPGSDNVRYVLVHRKGMLPYIPVTRKQYLSYSISYLTKFYDQIINGYDEMPVRTPEEQEAEKKKILDKYKKDYEKDPKKLKSATDYYLSTYQTDQQRRDELKNKTLKQKTNALKRYRDELEKTTAAHLLDAPAIVFSLNPVNDNTRNIFVTEAEGGQMLVIENLEYLRKDLPKYLPQFFVMAWSWESPEENIRKIIEANFPIEKLQAMIDK